MLDVQRKERLLEELYARSSASNRAVLSIEDIEALLDADREKDAAVEWLLGASPGTSA